MKTALKYSKNDIDKAGNVLAGIPDQKINQDLAIEILENFRSIHIHPLIVFRMSLERKTKIVSKNVLISQRLKRAPSIVNKLKIQKNMSLSQMQDIGGLRAVMNDLNEMYELRDLIRSGEKQTAFKSTFIRETDYVKSPKESGYRSIHLVYKYDKNVPINSQCRIEIQLRTKIHHAWATAVEVIGTYLRQPLKQSFGDKELLDLFKEISKVFILLESGAFDPVLFKKTSARIEELKLREKLKGFTVATQSAQSNTKEKGKYFLISLNFKDRLLSLRRFGESKLDQANNEYSELEKKYLNDKNTEVVLVSVDDINNLSKLYPNYFLDTEEFVKLLDLIDTKIKENK
ncbi:MAG: RelA/SpoT domain-containing protein [Candidatus Pacebacteria bacterium]|nr:RelA/SpoT domain-containing protein [Candidatus Paceibacterota bacterium]